MKRVGFIDGRRVSGFTLAGASALDGMKLDINDIGTPASGSNRGVYINYTHDGAKTGSAEVNALAVDLALKKNVTYAYAQSIYLSSSGNPTIGNVVPINIYVDDMGSGVSGVIGMALGLAIGAAGSGSCFIKMRNHVATIVKDGIYIQGTAPITNLFAFDTESSPIIVGAVGGTQPVKIKIRVAGTTYYIPLNTA